MTELSAAVPIDAEAEDSALQSAVWMVQDLGVAMPPIPDIYLNDLKEVALGRIFATTPVLATFQTRAEVAEHIRQTGWPPSGLALGFVTTGTGGRWYYCLTSEQQVLLLSIRVSFYTELAARVGRSVISQGNALLEQHLSNPANAARALASVPSTSRKVAAYSNELGVPFESRAIWNAEDGLADYVASFEVFTPGQQFLPEGDDYVIRA